ncbi:hypothetical protein EG68_12079 [Paragonimus skrjabini miyazakii]|uniref:Uncharacterized protein n=1 Tax=Paragonimus skrjabini miyazakii TaxID=59628 RepID=A0A8S9YAW7_9TREM|nr:hypothetical protein EG68_12079 [Paragonimus skrjabini miyazakii]
MSRFGFCRMKLSHIDCTEDNDNTSLTLVPTVTVSRLSYSKNFSPSTVSSLNVDLVQSTDEIFTLSPLKDVCNSNHAECIVHQCSPQQPKKTLLSSMKEIWTEGLSWPADELVVIQSDVSSGLMPKTHPTTHPKPGWKYTYLSTNKNVPKVTWNRSGLFRMRRFSSSSNSQHFQMKHYNATNKRVECGRSPTQTSTDTNSTLKDPIVQQGKDKSFRSQTTALTETGTHCGEHIQQYVSKYFPNQSKHALAEKINMYSRDPTQYTRSLNLHHQLKQPDSTDRNKNELNAASRSLVHSHAKVTTNRTTGSGLSSVERPQNGVQNCTQVRSQLHRISSLSSATNTSEVSGKQQIQRRYRFTIAPNRQQQQQSGMVSSETTLHRLDRGDQHAGTDNELHLNRVQFSPKQQMNDEQHRLNSKNTTNDSPDSGKVLTAMQQSLKRKTNHKNSVLRKYQMKANRKSIFPTSLITSFNTVSDKLARVNALSTELRRIQQQLKDIVTYSNLGKFYCLADAYISQLCVHLAPHILKATMDHSLIKPVKVRRLNKHTRFPRLSFLTLTPLCLRGFLGFRPRQRRCLQPIKYTTQQFTQAEKKGTKASKDILDLSNDNATYSVLLDSMHFNGTTRNSSPCTSHLQTMSEHCTFVGLPSWEQKFVGIVRGQLPPGSTVIAWKDNLELNKATIQWLKRAARQTIHSTCRA